MPPLTIASKNPGKINEIKSLLSALTLEIRAINELAPALEIAETGRTFEENARIKARAVHEITHGWVLADDSGLECEDLGWRPGVESARYAGPDATDEDNNKKLMEELRQIHDPSRVARYVCVIAVMTPEGEEHHFEGRCDGMITFIPGGTGGFGYDPYFFLPDLKCTMAQLDPAKKNSLSHRGKAMKACLAFLKKRI